MKDSILGKTRSYRLPHVHCFFLLRLIGTGQEYWHIKFDGRVREGKEYLTRLMRRHRFSLLKMNETKTLILRLESNLIIDVESECFFKFFCKR